ncbi:VOC family protein [Thermobifida cellulosilytica]|uniref:Glyoxalase n=1 Tax=Thermobifida cellulosilytica TB100 TaxID=665004 RepID=A0A147KDD9_THECS|nr:VOC family protein [Thermobifida cellulosilytica]KUP95316.1 glyoxalase [Thermobifida cellulosilytica TB100]
MPTLTGIAHVTLSVRDRDDSVEFYCDVLGFREYETTDDSRWFRTTCHHPCGLLLCLTQHRDRFNARFDHRHTGLDHLAFAVASLEELERWEERLDAFEVEHTPIMRRDHGALLMFEDPDGIQLELFCPALSVD